MSGKIYDQYGPFEKLVDKLSEEKLKDTSSSILIDDRALKFDADDLTDRDAVSKMFSSRDEAFAEPRIALLMYSIDHFFAAAQFQTHKQPSTQAEIKVFYDESAALEWLAGGKS